MATFKLGNDNLAWFALTQAGTYYLPAGQQDGKLGFKLATFDASTKDGAGFAVKGAGNIDVSFTLGLLPLLPDANGYTAIETVCFTYPRTPLFIKVRRNGTAATDADTFFGAAFWVSSLDVDMAKNNAVMTPFAFDLAAPPFVTLGLK
jgi:hypothetical protein